MRGYHLGVGMCGYRLGVLPGPQLVVEQTVHHVARLVGEHRAGGSHAGGDLHRHLSGADLVVDHPVDHVAALGDDLLAGASRLAARGQAEVHRLQTEVHGDAVVQLHVRHTGEALDQVQQAEAASPDGLLRRRADRAGDDLEEQLFAGGVVAGGVGVGDERDAHEHEVLVPGDGLGVQGLGGGVLRAAPDHQADEDLAPLHHTEPLAVHHAHAQPGRPGDVLGPGVVLGVRDGGPIQHFHLDVTPQVPGSLLEHLSVGGVLHGVVPLHGLLLHNRGGLDLDIALDDEGLDDLLLLDDLLHHWAPAFQLLDPGLQLLDAALLLNDDGLGYHPGHLLPQLVDRVHVLLDGDLHLLFDAHEVFDLGLHLEAACLELGDQLFSGLQFRPPLSDHRLQLLDPAFQKLDPLEVLWAAGA
mmetsp:Transcript_61952/g.110392  ORF Transcript_61952/g.110392 Transcript_61952/m.110392 type:complete len:413 (+) Transcript_61952:494-1732(+)